MTMFARVVSGDPVVTSYREIRAERRNRSWPSDPATLPEATLAEIGLARVVPVPPPAAGQGQVALRDGLEVVGGEVRQRWRIEAVEEEEPGETLEETVARLDQEVRALNRARQ